MRKDKSKLKKGRRRRRTSGKKGREDLPHRRRERGERRMRRKGAHRGDEINLPLKKIDERRRVRKKRTALEKFMTQYKLKGITILLFSQG